MLSEHQRQHIDYLLPAAILYPTYFSIINIYSCEARCGRRERHPHRDGRRNSEVLHGELHVENFLTNPPSPFELPERFLQKWESKKQLDANHFGIELDRFELPTMSGHFRLSGHSCSPPCVQGGRLELVYNFYNDTKSLQTPLAISSSRLKVERET